MKFIPYGRQSIDSQDIKEVVKTLKSQLLTQGPKITEFEQVVAKYCGVKYAIAVSNGTAALHLACIAAGLSENDEGITSPITFVASSNCMLYCKAKPVFADIEKETMNISVKDIENRITPYTKVIIPVHFAGHPCNMPQIYALARKHNLTVIEDAAHALGARYKHNNKWIKVGSCTHSDITILSFHPVKHITTGEGGMILTNKKDLYEKLIKLRSHGTTKTNLINNPDGEWYYEMQELGYNYRITDIQCALGISQIKKLDAFIDKRKEIVAKYNKLFKNNNFLSTPAEDKVFSSSCHLYVIKLKPNYSSKRKLIVSQLKEKNIGTQVHYIPVYKQPYYKSLGYKSNICQNAEDYYKVALSLPLFPTMTNSEVEYVAKTVLKVINDAK